MGDPAIGRPTFPTVASVPCSDLACCVSSKCSISVLFGDVFSSDLPSDPRILSLCTAQEFDTPQTFDYAFLPCQREVQDWRPMVTVTAKCGT